MSAPEVHGTYPVPDAVRELLARGGDIMRPIPPGQPPRRFPRIEPEELGLEPSAMLQIQRAINDDIRRQYESLQRQLAEILAAAPPGSRLCVHGIEMMTEDDSGDDVCRFMARQRYHLLPEGMETCPAPDCSRCETYEVPHA